MVIHRKIFFYFILRFNGSDEAEVLKAVEKAELVFDETDWRSISNDAKDLIRKML